MPEELRLRWLDLRDQSVHPALDLQSIGERCTDWDWFGSADDSAEAAEFFGHHAGWAGQVGPNLERHGP